MKYLMVGLLVLGMAFPSITQAQTVDPIQSQIDALVAQVAELQKLLTLIQQVEAITARLEAVETKTNKQVNDPEPVLGGAEPVAAPVIEVSSSASNTNSNRCSVDLEFRSTFDSYKISISPVSGHLFSGDDYGYRAGGGSNTGSKSLSSGKEGVETEFTQTFDEINTPVVYTYSFTAIKNGAETTEVGTFTIKKQDGNCTVE